MQYKEEDAQMKEAEIYAKEKILLVCSFDIDAQEARRLLKEENKRQMKEEEILASKSAALFTRK